MTAYRLEIDANNEKECFDLHAANWPDAEYEAEYVMHMFPLRLHRREGRLFVDGRLVKQFSEEAVDR